MGVQNISYFDASGNPVGITLATPLPTIATGTGTWVDRSGSIATGGTAQELAASNASRRGLFIQNVSDTDMWFDTLATAVADEPSIKIAAGASISVTAPDVPTGAVSIICATTGKKFAAREW